jgi:hypothetical protein
MPAYIWLGAHVRLSHRHRTTMRVATRQRRNVRAGFSWAASLRYFPVW